MKDSPNKSALQLGFGGLFCVRNKELDLPTVEDMVDLFLEAGFTCFDCAFAYEGVEDFLHEALVKRYPRDAYQLTEKITAWKLEDEGAARRNLERSYASLGVDYLDHLMLHNVSTMGRRIQIYEDFKAWDLMREYKEAGRVGSIGFSHHDNAEVLEQVLRAHSEVDFVLLPLNYLDWENEILQGRRNYEVARSFGKSVMIMKPLNGGLLVDLPSQAAAILEDAGMDPVQLAYRFCASLEGVTVMFSTFNTFEQAKHNIEAFKSLAPLSAEDRRIIARVVGATHDADLVACTHCRYCLQVCPRGINIPMIFSDMNQDSIYGNHAVSSRNYNLHTSFDGKASACIRCNACAEVCPQKLPIPDLLEKAADLFES